MSNDDFGDRMKLFERAEAARQFMPMLPICARLDGKCFSNFTARMERPYDVRMVNLMQEVTKKLVEETGACMGYTQSDEISLVWYSDNMNTQVFFNGKIQKMTSVLASMCTAWFNKLYTVYEKDDRLAYFDCRVWQVPSLMEATNVFLWREFDATKNSISMAARHYYSAKELYEKDGSEMQEMLFQKGVNWNDYPPFFKRGTYFQRKTKMMKFTAQELAVLPAKHEARANPDLMIERTTVEKLDMPPFAKVKNRVLVVFEGAEPEVVNETQPQSV